MRTRRLLETLCLLTFAALFILSSAGAAAQSRVLGQGQDASLERRVREVGAELRCPVCQNISVADSPSALAAEMRSVIRRKLLEGETREQIVQYFAGVYGEEVLLNPPRQGFTLLVWVGALLAVVGGAALLVTKLQRGLAAQPAGTDAAIPPVSPQPALTAGNYYERRLDAELASYKEAGG